MRVLLFSDADVFAGTERHMFDLANGLRHQNVEALIASPTPSQLKDRAEGAGIPHIAIQKGGLIDSAAVKSLRQLLISGRVDLIHAHNGRTMLSSAVAVSLAGKGAAVATQHFLEPDHVNRKGPKSILSGAAHHWVGGRLKHYIAISDAVRDSMLSRNEAPVSKITVIPNGMPPVELEKLIAVSQVRSSLGLHEGQVMLLCAARLEKEKDVTSLITAMEVVSRTLPDVICFVAGKGSLHSELTAQINRLGLSGKVKLLGFRDDILSLIAACDLFVLPSLAEPFGLVLLEAMALRKPVIATDAGGPREIVVSGNTGTLVPPAAPESLARAIVQICSEPGALTRLGDHGFARYQELFTAERMSKAMISVYAQALSGKS